jgi:hypothetical protein
MAQMIGRNLELALNHAHSQPDCRGSRMTASHLFCRFTFLPLFVIAVASHLWAANYYVDCSAGTDANTGTLQVQAWRSVEAVNRATFHPGDSILLKRGTVCEGMLAPKGSGAPNQPISIAAYGTGPLPIISGGSNEAAIKLYDQQYWHIQNVEAVGGSPYGIFIGGSHGELRHFRIRDVVVHDVPGEPKTKESGLIVISGSGGSATVHDVIVDGASVYGTTQWAGIIVVGQNWSDKSPDPRGGSDVIVRNCIVHDVAGDGILIMMLKNGLIENNAAWNTGMQPVEKIGTPAGMWEWMCENCTVQYNEGYATDSPGVDGGVFDIDYGNINNVLQYNYGHDSQGYCFSVFGSEGPVGNSINSEVRYNVCVNNARSPRLAKRQGAVYLSTWNNGFLDGVRIHNNTIYWNPLNDVGAVVSDAHATGTRANTFANNLIVSTVPTLISSNDLLQFNSNLFWYAGSGSPVWDYAGKTYRGWTQFNAATGQEAQNLYADPLLTAEMHLRPGSSAIGHSRESPNQCPMDASGKPNSGRSCDIGATAFVPQGASPNRDGTFSKLAVHGAWTLVSFLDPALPAADESSVSRRQVVVLKSLLNQYGPKGLRVRTLSIRPASKEELENRSYDWAMADFPLSDTTIATSSGSPAPVTALISPQGAVVQQWNGYTSALELGLKLRKILGSPSGMADIQCLSE